MLEGYNSHLIDLTIVLIGAIIWNLTFGMLGIIFILLGIGYHHTQRNPERARPEGDIYNFRSARIKGSHSYKHKNIKK